MKITILAVGKIKEKYWNMAIQEYIKRLSRYCKLTIIEVADEKNSRWSRMGVGKSDKRKRRNEDFK